MLYEFECDKFAKKVNGQLVPRGRIQLYRTQLVNRLFFLL